ncbi:hypothetical protein RFI_19416 [Reticulomyxa filosa]|uniref:Uncharacterized protein n=1 Tax=Reticulomyxa filosa TaxID=46433 RepID=X6MVP7_RETFI|nr:hypothetical protein RFI_19416 [Reticulomyxa filosa]|eukprot:ETO17889.1 hypothetical protein RFI_19416 [Reticulomyxa filosa]
MCTVLNDFSPVRRNDDNFSQRWRNFASNEDNDMCCDEPANVKSDGEEEWNKMAYEDEALSNKWKSVEYQRCNEGRILQHKNKNIRKRKQGHEKGAMQTYCTIKHKTPHKKKMSEIEFTEKRKNECFGNKKTTTIKMQKQKGTKEAFFW